MLAPRLTSLPSDESHCLSSCFRPLLLAAFKFLVSDESGCEQLQCLELCCAVWEAQAFPGTFLLISTLKILVSQNRCLLLLRLRLPPGKFCGALAFCISAGREAGIRARKIASSCKGTQKRATACEFLATQHMQNLLLS